MPPSLKNLVSKCMDDSDSNSCLDIFFTDFSICFHCSVKMDSQPNEKFCCCLSLRTAGIVISVLGIMFGIAGIVSNVILPDVFDAYFFKILITIGGMSTTTGDEPYSFINPLNLNSSGYCNLVLGLLIRRAQSK